jgi:hypothetical protein
MLECLFTSSFDNCEEFLSTPIIVLCFSAGTLAVVGQDNTGWSKEVDSADT